MSPSMTMRYEWKNLPWRKLDVKVFKLQKRIFRASQHGNVKTLHRLQRLAMTSRAACLLAVRKVTQDNRGKKTAGVDGVKSLTPEARLQLAAKIRTAPYQPTGSPTRRVWIPKPGRQEKRPLGIPTMEERARQALAKIALEPEWEAKFEANSFGFRPGRSAHDAIRYLYHCIADAPRYVLDADIEKCFDRINHAALLQKLGTFPALARVIKHWLKAGVMDGDTLFPTEEGTPQGGVLSPLLANIALYGLQTAIEQAFPASARRHPYTGERLDGARRYQWQPKVIVYADDFVILHQDRRAIEDAKHIAQTWLGQRGLKIKEQKTRITHTLHGELGTPGFDFLGFNIRQYEQGKTGYRHTHHGIRPFRTFIKPSQASKHSHRKSLSQVIRAMRAAPQADLIARLNPLITGWANYHAIGLAKELARMDHVLFQQLKRWTRRRHPKRHWHWVATKYWHPRGGNKWVFCTPDHVAILTPHARHVKRQWPVKDGSPFDGDWIYWSSRLGRHPGITPSVARLMHTQGGKCAHCGLYFTPEDVVEKDHIVPRSHGGSRHMENIQLLHAHCHDVKTAKDLAGCTTDKG